MALKSLQEIQKEIGEWSRKQFGNNVSKRTGDCLFSQNALTGIVEEVGELNHVTICMHQGRRGYDPTTDEGRAKYNADRNDALADILVFMCDYAYREDVDLLTVLNETWDKVVSKRTVANWEEHSHEQTTPTIDNSRLGLQEGETAVYGFCPKCGAPGRLRERRWNGNDVCFNGHEYPSSKAIYPESVMVQQTGQGFAEPPEEKTEHSCPRCEPVIKVSDMPTDSFGDGLHRELSNSYDRYCEKCKRSRIHRLNTTGICPDCYALISKGQ